MRPEPPRGQDGPAVAGETSTVFVDREVCLGSGQCALAVPEVFDQDDTGVVVLLNPVPGPRTAIQVREAALRCPVGAILVSPE